MYNTQLNFYPNKESKVKTKTTFFVSLLSALLATSAFANEYSDVFEKTRGVYAGVSVADAKGSARWENSGEVYKFGRDTLSGVFVGYSFVSEGGVMLGAEISYAEGPIVYTSLTTNQVTGRNTYTIDKLWDAKLRLGHSFQLGSNVATPYIAAGVSMADFSTKVADCGAKSGTNYGAGVDYQFDSGLLFGVGYLKRDGFSVKVGSQCVSSQGFDGKTEELQFRVGYKF